MDGFEQFKADPCIFREIVDGVIAMIIGVYVDNLLVGGSQEDCESLMLSLNKKFPKNGLGEWVWHREKRRVKYDQVIARSIRRELDNTL